MLPGPTSPQSPFSVVKAKRIITEHRYRALYTTRRKKTMQRRPRTTFPPFHSKRLIFTVNHLSRNPPPRQQTTFAPSIDPRRSPTRTRRDSMGSDDDGGGEGRVDAMWSLRENATATYERTKEAACPEAPRNGDDEEEEEGVRKMESAARKPISGDSMDET
ncbi:hypothetical protein NL676_028290 [Syzygium grande]|nr:hypothetical protein NL676_028290 [Syzygium grande]